MKFASVCEMGPKLLQNLRRIEGCINITKLSIFKLVLIERCVGYNKPQLILSRHNPSIKLVNKCPLIIPFRKPNQSLRFTCIKYIAYILP